jgi:hypothetical protein
MTELFLFIAFLLGMIIVIFKSSFFSLKDLSRINLIILFLLKVGIAFLTLKYYQSYENHKLTSDFQVFYFQAEKLFIQFYNQPKELINLILTSKSDAEEINLQLNKLNYWNRDFDYGLFNDNQTMIRINLFFLFISNKSYTIHLLLFTFIGFIGLTSLIKTLSLYNNRINKFYANILYLFPTSIIWTSGMLKETLLIGILGTLIYLIAKRLKTPKNKYTISFLILLSLYFAMHIKPLFVLLSIPSILFMAINNYIKKHTSLTIFITTHSIFILFFFLITFISKTENSSINKDTIKYGYKFDMLRSLTYKQDDFFYEAKMKKAESTTELNKLDGTTISLIKTIPDAIQNVFLKPSILDIQNKKLWPFIIENCLLIILLIYLFNVRKNIEWTSPLFLFFIGLALTSGIFIGILNPIIGTLVRFKTISYLFLYTGIISIIPKKTL